MSTTMWIDLDHVNRLDTCCPKLSACLFMLNFSCLNVTKFSKQSALAVSQYLRDNQQQSTGKFKFALA